MRELQTLRSLPSPEVQHSYLVDRPYLVSILCRSRTCTTKKLGEVPLGPGGEFTYCFLNWGGGRRRCTDSFAFRVTQQVGGVDVVVYDGLAAHDHYTAGDPVEIHTYHPLAEACDVPEPPVEGEGEPFVLLQAIGKTDTHALHSPTQTALDGLGRGLPSNGGLLDFGGTPDCPLGASLDLLLYVDPGMQGLSAEYYRFSWAPADGNGNPATAFQRLDQAVSWRRWDTSVFPPDVEAETLGPVTAGGEPGLYRIPYVTGAKQWLGNQFHYRLDTTAFANGRYVLLLEIFDGGGNRLRPNGATGAGTDTGFHFLRWTTPTATENVPFASVAHVLHIDNTSCLAKIEDLRKDGTPNTADCQFMTGSDGTQFSVGYRAYHVNDFMRGWSLKYQKGLHGSPVALDSGGSANRPATAASGSPAVSASESYSVMLDGSPKCTFSVDLWVSPKHTNGDDRLHGYGAHDQGSFALEIEP